MSSPGPAADGEGGPGQPASEREPDLPDARDESEEDEEDGGDDEEEEKSLIVEGKREKKKVERLTMQVSSLQREPFTIAQGKGQKLCEIERIHFFLSKKKTDELRNLHKLLYNRPGTVSSLKKNVGQFSGFPFEKGSVQYKKKEEMLKKFRNAMLKSICEVLDLERSGVNSELVKRILNFLMHPKPSGKPLPKSKKSSSKGNKKERNSSGMARKAKRARCPEILSDESSSDEDEKRNKEESSDDEDKESEEEPPKKTSKREKPKQKATSKSKKSVKSANVKKADSSTTKKNQNSSKKESESEDSSDDEPLIKKLKKPPTDEELKETVKKLLANANLEEVTMKQICKEVYENYPAYDLTERKDFIKTTVKEVSVAFPLCEDFRTGNFKWTEPQGLHHLEHSLRALLLGTYTTQKSPASSPAHPVKLIRVNDCLFLLEKEFSNGPAHGVLKTPVKNILEIESVILKRQWEEAFIRLF